MRILEKQQINTLKAIEKKREVDEGLKLAHSVDALRETKAKEENNLRQFRDKSLETIKADIDSLLIQKNLAMKVLEDLEKARIEAEAPLDLKQAWKDVETDKVELNIVKGDILNREASLIQRESSIEASKKEFFVRDEKLKEQENLSNRYNLETKNAYDKAAQIKLQSEKELEKATKYSFDEDNRLRGIAESISIRERDVQNEKEVIEQMQIDIDREKLNIASQQETLRKAWVSINNLKK